MPFTTEQFFIVFREYNLFVYPSQIIILLLGLVSIFIVRLKIISSVKMLGVFLAVLWIWIGYVYHIIFFSTINSAAIVFGIFFIIQGILFLFAFLFGKKIEFKTENTFQMFTGYFFIIFGIILYPLIGMILGKSLDVTISLGLPCPSVIYTFGIFILAGKSLPKYLLIIPTLWALLGFFAAVKFGVYQDVMLPISAIASISFLFLNKKAEPETV